MAACSTVKTLLVAAYRYLWLRTSLFFLSEGRHIQVQLDGQRAGAGQRGWSLRRADGRNGRGLRHRRVRVRLEVPESGRRRAGKFTVDCCCPRVLTITGLGRKLFGEKKPSKHHLLICLSLSLSFCSSQLSRPLALELFL